MPYWAAAAGQRLGVGLRGVGAAERFDARLQELARRLAAVAEHQS
jgi:hypothetical protein